MSAESAVSESELDQQLVWLEQEVATSLRAASTRQEYVRLVQIQSRLQYIASLVHNQ